MRPSLHWRNLNPLSQDAFNIFDGFKATVVMSNMGVELPLAIHARRSNTLIIARLYMPAGSLPTPWDAFNAWHSYIDQTVAVVDGYQILNEPNLEYGISPERFTDWFLETLALLRRAGARFGFPMPNVAGAESFEWALWCGEAIRQADFIAEHCYWELTWPIYAQMDDINWGSRYYRCHEAWPDKEIHITEFGCSADLSRAERIEQYRCYLRTLPGYVSSASAFIMSNHLVNPTR